MSDTIKAINKSGHVEQSTRLFDFKPYIAADVFWGSQKSCDAFVVVSNRPSVISFAYYLVHVRHSAKIFIHSACAEVLDGEWVHRLESDASSSRDELNQPAEMEMSIRAEEELSTRDIVNQKAEMDMPVRAGADGSSENRFIVYESPDAGIRSQLSSHKQVMLMADEDISMEVLREYQGILMRAVYVTRREGSTEAFSVMDVFCASAEYICVQTPVQRWWKGTLRPDMETLRFKKTDNELLLSVILPVYNVSRYLDQCLKGLLAWESPFVEFVFVDDGSPDDSAEVIRRYMREDSRIRLIQKENGGCASARNAGLREARGKYVAFFDPDDFCDKTMFAKLLARAMQGDYDLEYCGYNEYDEATKECRPVLNEKLKEPYTTGVTTRFGIDMLTVNTRVAIWRYIVKKEVLERAGIMFMESIRRFDDLPFRIEMIFASRSVVCVPEHLYHYRLGRPGQDVSCHDERLGVHFPIFRHLDARIRPMKMQHRIDMLQIVKIHTHGYALEMLEPKYRRKYRKMARRDLWKNCSKGRTLLLMLRYSGLKNLKWMYF